MHQTDNLMENTERFVFRTNDNLRLHLLKNEIVQQIQNFRIVVTADGYFNINRSFLAGVRIKLTFLSEFFFVCFS